MYVIMVKELIKDKRGYIFRRISKGVYVPEHRVIMEKLLKRKLKTEEVVHHIDRNRSNNELSNLRVMTNKEHLNLHEQDAIKKNIENRKGIYKKCETCGKIMYLSLWKQKDNRRYCSCKCGGIARRGNKSSLAKDDTDGKIITCLICKKEFYINPARVRKKNVKFCSNKCKGIWLKNMFKQYRYTNIKRISEGINHNVMIEKLKEINDIKKGNLWDVKE